MYMKFFIQLILLSSICFCQISTESIPKSFELRQELSIPLEQLPAFNIENFLIEDENDKQSLDTKPYRFANPIEVNFNMDNSGEWFINDDGSSIWILQIDSPGAYSLNIIYDIFNIPEGAEFFVYSENREMVLGAFTDLNHKPHGGFSTAPVIGDKLPMKVFLYKSSF